MEYPESLPVTVLDRYPKVDEARVDADLAEALAGLGRKIVVLDDDPTGVQTVHHVPVYTDWRPQTLLEAFSEDCPMFFILTNSRAFTAAETGGFTGSWPTGSRTPPRKPAGTLSSSAAAIPRCAATIRWRPRRFGRALRR